MLLYLPERIYEYVKNDEYYHKWAEKYTEEIFYKNDFLNIIKEYNNDNPYLTNMANYILARIPKYYKLEYYIVIDDDISSYEKYFNNMDVETKIYYLYAYNFGDMSWSEEAEERNQLCIKLYEDNILDKQYNCSLFIHTIYYFRKVYELLFKYTKRKLVVKEFENFKKEELELFNKLIAISDNESFKHIMYSKREQMYILYLEFIGQFMKNKKEIFDKIWEEINNEKFKYNYFSYFKLSYYLMCFQQYMDESDINNAKNCLDKLIELITYAYNNKRDACDSLNHYNKDFIDDFLVLSKFIYDMVYTYMPNLSKKWDILHNCNIKPSEYRYYTSMLNNDDKEIVKNFNVNDRFFGYGWLPSNKEILKCIDYLYLDK